MPACTLAGIVQNRTVPARHASSRHAETVREITAAARRLVIAEGLDGFTMEDLAAAVGVSRRTLFNHVAGKLDAVLGPAKTIDADLLPSFLGGGPTGHLASDVRELVCAVLRGSATDPEEIGRLRRALRTDGRLLQAAHDRFVAQMEQFSNLIVEREGDRVDVLEVRVLTRLTVSIFDVAIDRYLADRTRSLAEHFTCTFDAAVAVLATSEELAHQSSRNEEN